ncbi:DUF317 domain-containing protein [Streptomyces sp. NPDC057746]|uniref:DUF317 domain-containing protein n=1 Tax=Streptomyces sp. NPDC057746 TaxID=3346237 RepID=UPI0036ACB9E8
MVAQLHRQRPRVARRHRIRPAAGQRGRTGRLVRHRAALGTDRPVWQPRFGAHTPAYLVAAFTAALADPKPVLRMDSGRSLPTCDPNVVTRRTTDVLAVYVAGTLEERVHTLATRHTAPPTRPIPKREPSAKNSRSR